MMWLGLTLLFFCIFVVFTFVVKFVDVNQVGLSHLNQFFWQLCGKSTVWKYVTDIIGYLVILAAFCLVAVQVYQLVQRKKLRLIDRNLLSFDIVCACLVAVYVFFEIVIINYRPELDNGVLKASYPSSHVMLFVTILPILIGQIKHYLNHKTWRIVLTSLLCLVLVIGVVGRLLSGVHWFTDIFAGLIVGVCLNCLYMFLIKIIK